MKKYLCSFILFGAFFGALSLFMLSAQQDAKGIRDGLLRFHIIGASNSDADQQLKLKVRDGIAKLCSELFSQNKNKEQAMQTARQNKELFAERAEQILRQNGCDDSVSVAVTSRFFPTRHYDGVSLPAGVYDTLDVKIGEAAGRNFWCVMFPDICIGTSSAYTNKEKLDGVLDSGSYDMATDKKTPSDRFKFKAVEIFETIKNYLCSKKQNVSS